MTHDAALFIPDNASACNVEGIVDAGSHNTGEVEVNVNPVPARTNGDNSPLVHEDSDDKAEDHIHSRPEAEGGDGAGLPGDGADDAASLPRIVQRASSSESTWLIRSAAARKKVRQQISNSLSNSSSDGVVNGGLKSVWLKDVESEAKTIWKEGKELGVSFLGSEEDIVNRLVQLEQRDAKVVHAGFTAATRGIQGGGLS